MTDEYVDNYTIKISITGDVYDLLFYAKDCYPGLPIDESIVRVFQDRIKREFTTEMIDVESVNIPIGSHSIASKLNLANVTISSSKCTLMMAGASINARELALEALEAAILVKASCGSVLPDKSIKHCLAGQEIIFTINEIKEFEDFLVTQNKKIQAIKYIRTICGCGLKEAKGFVEMYQAQVNQGLITLRDLS